MRCLSLLAKHGRISLFETDVFRVFTFILWTNPSEVAKETTNRGEGSWGGVYKSMVEVLLNDGTYQRDNKFDRKQGYKRREKEESEFH